MRVRPRPAAAPTARTAAEANYGPIMEGPAARHTVVGVDLTGTAHTPRAQEPLELDELVDQLIAAADAEQLDTFAVSGGAVGFPQG
ncbi:alpha/beta hydrolase, partial [Spongiactinospora gelatinilytica]